jgi:hypothetical protein
MHYRCKCNALCRILAGKDYKRLEFFGTHDENSHANDASKKLDWSHLRFSFDCAEAVSNSTSLQFDASQGQSG